MLVCGLYVRHPTEKHKLIGQNVNINRKNSAEIQIGWHILQLEPLSVVGFIENRKLLAQNDVENDHIDRLSSMSGCFEADSKLLPLNVCLDLTA